ncbi:alpha/beta hydrolase [Georgenia yuyongxinii]|uniref:Alpha/beta hydrolase n=1 Tax=Georgenia yuyongxinii TaxID=2589797 RepID=A0A5B8C367_9MICO|nr:alpha/beta hydrolase [Georgenia yuyongxinii]QDC23941.1 alpha/beta hydrolase [Georgenia yuyongxinii]
MRMRPLSRPVRGAFLAATVALVALPLGGAASAAGGVAPSALDWAPCPDAAVAECATLHVPVDWHDRHGEQIDLAVARRPADDPDHRVGTLFYNPGGPGDGGVGYVIAAEEIFSPALRARFDIVAMDPRGVGASTPVRCGLPVLTPETTLWPRTEEQFDALVAHNRAVGESCLEETGALLGHLDTVSVARDHEALRRALDVEEVSWLGISYGTQVGANYAQLFPDRTRALALDAALEHSLPEVVQVADEMRAAEDSFNRFAEWCGTSDTCALRGQDVAAVYDELVAAADAAPIPVEGALHAVRGEDIRTGTIGRLTFKEPSIYGPDVSWAGLSRALAATLAGDASAFAVPGGEPQTGLFAQAGIGCMEYVPQVGTYEEMRQRIQLGKQTAPHLQGASETWQVNLCIGWPLEAANPPRLLDVTGVPTLIVHATYDPSVPYKWAHSLAAQISGSHLLTREGDGHTSYYTSACAREAVDAFLVDLTVPEREVCD